VIVRVVVRRGVRGVGILGMVVTGPALLPAGPSMSGRWHVCGSRLSRPAATPGARRLCGGFVTVYHSRPGPHQGPA
jgi:hypothetical protein